MGKQQERGKPTISKWDRIYNFYITSNSYGFRESSKSLQVHWSIIVFPMKVAIMARGSPSEWVKLDQLDPCEIETTLTIIQPKRWVRDHHLSIIYILTMVITGNMKKLHAKKNPRVDWITWNFSSYWMACWMNGLHKSKCRFRVCRWWCGAATRPTVHLDG